MQTTILVTLTLEHADGIDMEQVQDAVKACLEQLIAAKTVFATDSDGEDMTLARVGMHSIYDEDDLEEETKR